MNSLFLHISASGLEITQVKPLIMRGLTGDNNNDFIPLSLIMDKSGLINAWPDTQDLVPNRPQSVRLKGLIPANAPQRSQVTKIGPSQIIGLSGLYMSTR